MKRFTSLVLLALFACFATGVCVFAGFYPAAVAALAFGALIGRTAIKVRGLERLNAAVSELNHHVERQDWAAARALCARAMNIHAALAPLVLSGASMALIADDAPAALAIADSYLARKKTKPNLRADARSIRALALVHMGDPTRATATLDAVRAAGELDQAHAGARARIALVEALLADQSGNRVAVKTALREVARYADAATRDVRQRARDLEARVAVGTGEGYRGLASREVVDDPAALMSAAPPARSAAGPIPRPDTTLRIPRPTRRAWFVATAIVVPCAIFAAGLLMHSPQATHDDIMAQEHVALDLFAGIVAAALSALVLWTLVNTWRAVVSTRGLSAARRLLELRDDEAEPALRKLLKAGSLIVRSNAQLLLAQLLARRGDFAGAHIEANLAWQKLAENPNQASFVKLTLMPQLAQFATISAALAGQDTTEFLRESRTRLTAHSMRDLEYLMNLLQAARDRDRSALGKLTAERGPIGRYDTRFEALIDAAEIVAAEDVPPAHKLRLGYKLVEEPELASWLDEACPELVEDMREALRKRA